MKLTNILRGRRVRKAEWAPDEWIKIKHVGIDFVTAISLEGKEIVFPLSSEDVDWILFNPQIPLKPLKKDWEEDDVV